jgi:hypothetical protein
VFVLKLNFPPPAAGSVACVVVIFLLVQARAVLRPFEATMGLIDAFLCSTFKVVIFEFSVPVGGFLDSRNGKVGTLT